MLDLLKALVDWVVNGIKSIIDLLPDTPFCLTLPSFIADYMGNVNYFVPVGMMVNTLIAWTACIAVFYACMIFMRWLKAID